MVICPPILALLQPLALLLDPVTPQGIPWALFIFCGQYTKTVIKVHKVLFWFGKFPFSLQIGIMPIYSGKLCIITNLQILQILAV